MNLINDKAALVLFLASFLTTATALADDEVFEISEISIEGRVVSAGFADFDGDGSIDIAVTIVRSTGGRCNIIRC